MRSSKLRGSLHRTAPLATRHATPRFTTQRRRPSLHAPSPSGTSTPSRPPPSSSTHSTIWLARALPAGGRRATRGIDSRPAAVARDSTARAGLADVVDVRVGRALDTLPALAAEGRDPFDLIFIDADKQHNRDYLRWALRLARGGTVIVVDNV